MPKAILRRDDKQGKRERAERTRWPIKAPRSSSLRGVNINDFMILQKGEVEKQRRERRRERKGRKKEKGRKEKKKVGEGSQVELERFVVSKKRASERASSF